MLRFVLRSATAETVVAALLLVVFALLVVAAGLLLRLVVAEKVVVVVVRYAVSHSDFLDLASEHPSMLLLLSLLSVGMRCVARLVCTLALELLSFLVVRLLCTWQENSLLVSSSKRSARMS